MLATGSYRSFLVPLTWYAVEGRLDHLEQTLGGDAVPGVDVPVVDRPAVAAGLPDDVAVDPLVGAGDAFLLHDRHGLADPAVQVVGVDGLARGGAVGGLGAALLRVGLGLGGLLGLVLRVRRGLGLRGLRLGLGGGLRLGGVGGLHELLSGGVLLDKAVLHRLGLRGAAGEGDGAAAPAACGATSASAFDGTSEKVREATARADTPATEIFWTLFRRRTRLGMRVADMSGYLFVLLRCPHGGRDRRRRCAPPSGTRAILSGSKIVWQRCDVRSRVVGAGPVRPK